MNWFITLLQEWMRGHAAATLDTYARCCIAGILGGGLLLTFKNPEILLPERKGSRIKLGFVGVLVAGALFGLLTDHSIPVAMVAGLFGPTLTDFILSHAGPSLLRLLLKGAAAEITKMSKEDDK
jgi:hypothetical protein